MTILKCLNCEKEFIVPDWKARRGQKYCGPKCVHEAKKGITPPGFRPGKVTLICLQCGQEFECWKAWVRRGRRKFCSWECKSAYQKTLTGTKSARFGVKHTEETKEKMRGTTRAQGSRNANWKGGRAKTSHGYCYINEVNLQPETKELVGPMLTKAGYVLEHRLVAAIHLGRPLKSTEKVHHINGDKLDNRWKNLQVFPVGGHSRKHREVDRQLSVFQKENVQLRAEVSRLTALLAIYQGNDQDVLYANDGTKKGGDVNVGNRTI